MSSNDDSTIPTVPPVAAEDSLPKDASPSPTTQQQPPKKNLTGAAMVKQVKEYGVGGYFEKTEDYKHFKEWVPKSTIETAKPNKKTWTYYQYGPRQVTPLIFLHGMSGSADCFFHQILSLSVKGYHVISINIPPCFTHDEFIIAFDEFLTGIQQKKVHLLGVGLGGFLALSYAEFMPDRIESIVLSNAFVDTEEFHKNAPCAEMFAFMPGFVLKKFVLNAYPQTPQEIMIIRSLDFMIDKLESLSQREIASRMTLNCTPRYIQKLKIPDEKITIIDCVDDTIYPISIRDNVYKLFPNARLAFLKTGGDFPFLSREAEFTMHVQVHLRATGGQSVPISEGTTAETSSAATKKPEASKEDFFLPATEDEQRKQEEEQQAKLLQQEQAAAAVEQPNENQQATSVDPAAPSENDEQKQQQQAEEENL